MIQKRRTAHSYWPLGIKLPEIRYVGALLERVNGKSNVG